ATEPPSTPMNSDLLLGFSGTVDGHHGVFTWRPAEPPRCCLDIADYEPPCISVSRLAWDPLGTALAIFHGKLTVWHRDRELEVWADTVEDTTHRLCQVFLAPGGDHGLVRVDARSLYHISVDTFAPAMELTHPPFPLVDIQFRGDTARVLYGAKPHAPTLQW